MKERWAQRDPSLVAGMKKLGTLADAAVACLQNDQGGSRHYAISVPDHGAILGPTSVPSPIPITILSLALTLALALKIH